MKKLLLLLFLILASFSTFAQSDIDFTLSDFCYLQPNVQNRSGVYYFPNQSVGITDTSICVYKDVFGQYASKGNVVRGVLDGLWTGWRTNGEILLESYYINGKVVPIVCRDDLLEFDKDETYYDLYDEPLTGYNRCKAKYLDDSKVSIRGEIINGKREGLWIVNFPNKDWLKANYLNGKFDGGVAEGYHKKPLKKIEGLGYEIVTKSMKTYKDGECVTSEPIYKSPCSGEDEQSEQDSIEQQKKNELEALRVAEEALVIEQQNRALADAIEREQDLARQLIIEDQLNTLKSAYVNNIAARIRSYWNYQGAEDDWRCDVYVQQDRDGTVEAVNVQNCKTGDSDNALMADDKARSFKNSIERAVYKASPLPAAPDDAVFDREILLEFRIN